MHSAFWRFNMQPIHALSTEHVVGEVLVYNFQILFKQTSIIAAAGYKHVSVLPSQTRYVEYTPHSGTTG